MSTEEVFEKVKAIIVEQLGVAETAVEMDASFIDDLGADSLDIVELVMALEEEFDLEIPDSTIDAIINSALREIQRYIAITNIMTIPYSRCIDLSGKKISKLDDIINSENEKITDGKITISNVNGDYDYTYKELGIKTNKDDVKNKIINYNKNLSLIDKLKMIN